MISLELKLPNGTQLDMYQSTTVGQLLTSHNVNITQLFPSPDAGLVSDWKADSVIATLEQVQKEVQATATGSSVLTTYDVALDALNDQQRALMAQTSVRHYTLNDVAHVAFSAPAQRESVYDPAARDLDTLVETLKRGRNSEAQLLTLALDG